MYTRPLLFTFDVLGTLVDWRRGLSGAAARAGRPLREGEFDRVVDRQAVLEQERPGWTYREVTRQSLVDVLGIPTDAADAIGAEVGTWPPYPDSAGALRRLMAVAPCAAITNSDLVHGEQAQAALGVRLSAWLCAQELGCYKPDLHVFELASERLGVAPGPAWWHVSAYADYDLAPADMLGITTIYVRRPHARPGRAEHEVADLAGLADLVEGIRWCAPA
jgi:2-haloacid dehalogenase